jgi:hypothetical protein
MTVARPASASTAPAVPRRGLAAVARIALSALIVGAAAFAGYLAAGVGGGEQASRAISAGPVRLTVPSGWEVGREAAPPGGLRLEHAAAAHPPKGQGLALAGALPDVVFPQELGASVDPAAPAPDAVRLGMLEAYRWRNLEGEEGPVTLLAAPTGMGTAVVACAGPAEAMRRCERAATTLDVRGADPTPLDALAFYATELDTTLSRLERGRRDAIGRLRARAPRSAHAASATRLSAAHERAAEALAALAPPAAAASANEALVEALRSTGAAYADLARAARSGRRARYSAAARAAERRERAVRRIVAGMAPPA